MVDRDSKRQQPNYDASVTDNKLDFFFDARERGDAEVPNCSSVV